METIAQFRDNDVVTMAVSKRGDKAADMLFFLSHKVEQAFEVTSDFIKGQYIAIVSKPKMAVI